MSTFQLSRSHGSHVGCRARASDTIWKRTIQGESHPILAQFASRSCEEDKNVRSKQMTDDGLQVRKN